MKSFFKQLLVATFLPSPNTSCEIGFAHKTGTIGYILSQNSIEGGRSLRARPFSVNVCPPLEEPIFCEKIYILTSWDIESIWSGITQKNFNKLGSLGYFEVYTLSICV